MRVWPNPMKRLVGLSAGGLSVRNNLVIQRRSDGQEIRFPA